MVDYINVIGAGLAGSEAAWQIAKRGIKVKLYEMKPHKLSPAHHLETFAELVCSNSLRSAQLENAVGLLKEEMRIFDSIILKCADATSVPAGGALAVDRTGFSEMVTELLKKAENIEIISEEIKSLPEDGITIIATGPLTSDDFSGYLGNLIGKEYLYFFDAAAPIVEYNSIDMSKAFRAARYGRGTDDYINCPMNREQYEYFLNELINAQTADIKDFEKNAVFEGCMPVESMAQRGKDTLRFGPLKPVGLVDPNTGKEPYAVVQLRQDNAEGTLYNIVGFQTRLKWPEQKRVFGLIPGLENAEFVRYGVMHRNTFINSPGKLDGAYRLMEKPNLFFAGQMTGVEGYVESASSGMVAGINAALRYIGKDVVLFPKVTALGSLSSYISNPAVKDFQPMNVNFGLMDGLDIRIRDKRKKNFEISQRALGKVMEIKNEIEELFS
ncbi:methylenetetrahydrofolate--tRNA-(uracil(54)-C(5))-methyltransferase (FADH(2)-oxidizing) TrmFO [Pseudobacteroides cellulosolvens]|uniref:Methylenetetrahydrofolate--tRNA-(uracil-5-)-methyltransferase TrmFO n=1 Tax=Pseudobacteroides cellulosolvens ATCC 35603 = DSM 2933 TaxID=398512 RepID=A0A0L6JRI1_9FIRM|nr:methylenetetrahydrofolate--tRNA-(uracil(54)-C(5))-methyltransferase (FADH(2)-oxidizing) TrmFO [Pseudobacteroides cellulosolvens]KNY28388.1 Methylenetetrahydrofolate--tRNA-(uracil-5-)-methyltransferase trmFO [Pseudobacteroides cellulosolvens ATCC 35603 = DSM 2933]